MGMKIETSFDHVWLIHDHIDKIAAETGTGIRIPDISNLKELPKKYCIWIRGPSVDSVYAASTFLTVSRFQSFLKLLQHFSDQFSTGWEGTFADAIDGPIIVGSYQSLPPD
jgi:hypothetical protein